MSSAAAAASALPRISAAANGFDLGGAVGMGGFQAAVVAASMVSSLTSSTNNLA
eukprot:CAMPEP_0181375670 /NCGR_PEP_ID=MMETSP1106-20121128/16846_1 /TAXON_ID=81844 /ORGANISM="Mantoniella antarctica, Strain SL-175" /LENGTH=53 /DNA_ID=CAMNT_0023494071 /DNA_START=137 /DNA_END=296 /DNA_ORIENTATION=+